MIKKTLKILFFIIGLAVYLNIGWALGTYMHDNVRYPAKLEGAVAVFFAGPGKILNNPPTGGLSRTEVQLSFSLFWPFEIMLVIGSWMVYVGYWILWLMFAGGIAKLFGVG